MDSCSSTVGNGITTCRSRPVLKCGMTCRRASWRSLLLDADSRAAEHRERDSLGRLGWRRPERPPCPERCHEVHGVGDQAHAPRRSPCSQQYVARLSADSETKLRTSPCDTNRESRRRLGKSNSLRNAVRGDERNASSAPVGQRSSPSVVNNCRRRSSRERRLPQTAIAKLLQVRGDRRVQLRRLRPAARAASR